MLLDKFEIKNKLLKNRIVMPPMVTRMATDGFVSDFHLVHYGIRSEYGVGMIMLEATAVVPEGRISLKDLGIWDDSHVYGLSRITEYLRENGTISCLQLAHAGRKSDKSLDVVGPSSIAFSDDYKTPRELSTSEIKKIVDAYKDAAIRAKKAGFDAVEVHGAHGYLLNSFLTPLINKREDEYGGSFENRVRFLEEVVTTVRENFDGILSVRISADDHAEGGLTVEDYFEVVERLEQLGVDMIDVSSGGVVSTSYNLYPGYQVQYSEKIKQRVSIPVTAVGLITDYQLAKNIIRDGRADLIQFGRELLRNPSLVLQFAKLEGKDLDLAYPYAAKK